MSTTLKQLELHCGSQRYAKFVSVLKGQSKVSGRLLFWQEQLLRDFSVATGQQIPTDLDSVLELFRHVPIAVPSKATHDSFRFPDSPVIRQFSSVNQTASGGSHVTVFSVRILGHDVADACAIVDMAAPHEQPDIAGALLDALSKGVVRFLENQLTQGRSMQGFRVELLDYRYDETDLKPYKYSPALLFVLEDLLCEVNSGRRIVQKLVGIPL